MKPERKQPIPEHEAQGPKPLPRKEHGTQTTREDRSASGQEKRLREQGGDPGAGNTGHTESV